MDIFIYRDCDAAALAHPLAVGGLAPVLRPVPARHVGQLQRGAAGGHLAILVPQPLLLISVTDTDKLDIAR